MTAIKICGCTNRGDVELALAWGANYVGFILAPSARNIDLHLAAEIARDLPPAVSPVAVLVKPTLAQFADIIRAIPRVQIQLSGDETPTFASSIEAPVMKAIHVAATHADPAQLRGECNRFGFARILFDTKIGAAYGGTGQTFAWDAIADLAREREVFIAGGLTPTNVAGCITAVHPFGVDVRSGVETDGHKDPVKVHAFCKAVKDVDET
ncbi:MAG: phosphoribosylanthranilate isomerase [Vulcanimicrobiaceae bacterium]